VNKAMKLNIELVRRQWGLYSVGRLLVVTLLCTSIAVGIKTLLFFIPEKSALQFYLLLASFIAIMPITDVSYTQMSDNHKKMMTYFKVIPLQDIQNYYIYRKFYLFIGLLVYVFLPLTETMLMRSLFATSLLAIYVTMTSSIERCLKRTAKKKVILTLLKYVAIIVLWGLSRNGARLGQLLAQIPLFYFACVIFVMLALTHRNLRVIYAQQTTMLARTVRYRYIKDVRLLYVLRTNTLISLVTILIVSFIGYDQPLFYAEGFAFTLVASYWTLYASLLHNEEGTIQLFYKPNTLYRIRFDNTKTVCKCSLVYCLFAIILGVYTEQLMTYVFAYIFTTSMFITLTLTHKLNIEKKRDEKVTRVRDNMRLLLVSMTFVFIFYRFLAML